MRLFFILGLAAAIVAPCSAQQVERWRLALASSVVLWDVSLVQLDEDVLVVRRGQQNVRVPLRKITELRRLQTSVPASGAEGDVYQVRVWDLEQKRRVIRDILNAPSTLDTGQTDRPG